MRFSTSLGAVAGCSWRMLPHDHDFPDWQTVYHYFHFRQWRKDGTWQLINDQLRRDLREQMGRDREPSAAIYYGQPIDPDKLMLVQPLQLHLLFPGMLLEVIPRSMTTTTTLSSNLS